MVVLLLVSLCQEMASRVAFSFSVAMNNNDTTTTTGPQRKKAKTQKWLCDVCKVKKFLDIKECEAHEAICRPSAVVASKEKMDVATADAVESPTKPPSTVDSRPLPPPSPVKREQFEWLSAEKANAKRQRTTKNNDTKEMVDLTRAGKGNMAPSLHPFFQGTKATAATTAKQKSQKKSRRSQECNDPSNPNDAAKPTQEEAIKIAAAARRKTKTDENSLNAFFQGATTEEIRAMQAAQKVAEFQAKRRRQQELERERRQKRQKQPMSGCNASPENDNGDGGSKNHSNNKPKAHQQHTKQSNVEFAPFPVPSHVYPKEENVFTSELDAASNLVWNAGRVGKALRQDLPWLTKPVVEQQEEEEKPFIWNSTPTPSDSPLQRPCDLLLQTMDALFVPSTECDDEDVTTGVSEVDHLPEAGLELADFLEKWKEVREMACQRMEERHAKLAGRVKKKSTKAPSKSWKKSKYEDDSDDYFFSGSESEDEENAMTSLFLLTGDVGVGKTSLVYKVAKQADCGVLEVNTTEVRGAVSLRKRIQEATQTHAANWNKKASIASVIALKDKFEKKAKAAALMVILLDEVDLLYPENGDNGFWNALSDVSKKAKAPIVLTANKIPEELLSPAFRYQHIHVESSLDRCATFLLSAAKRAGFCVRPERMNFADSDAERIAYLAKGDYRRITMALEALKATPKDVVRKGTWGRRIELLSRQARKPNSTMSTTDKAVRIANIQPQCVPANQPSLITITGEGFLSFAEPPCLGASGGYPVIVRIGQTDSPQARILDDTTILAVCPAVMGGNDTSLHILSPNLHYADVSLSASKRTGLVSTTSGIQIQGELSDGTPWLTSQNVVLLEYYTGNYEKETIAGSDENSDEGYELEDTAPTKTPSSALFEANSKAALQIISEGIGAWLSQKHEIPIVDEPDEEEDDIGLELIEKVSRNADFESDAAFIEDCGLHGLPFLAGGSIPFDTVEKSNTLQFQRSQKQGHDTWYCGSDSFMVRPLPREGRLLTRIEHSLRGSCYTSATSETEEEGSDTTIFKEEPEDDVLLPQRVPNAFHDLPGCLRSRSNVSFPTILWDFAFHDRKQDIWEYQLNLLRKYAFAYNRVDLKLFYRGLNRDTDCLLDSEDFLDNRLLLDYLPILRIIAVLERASDHFFSQQKDDEVVSNLSNRSRSTRAATKKGREHYFETAFEYLKGLHDSEHAREVGKSFSHRFLGYY